MARREQREEASRRRRRETEASQARLLSARLSGTHSPRDLERMDTPSPLPSSPVGRLNRIEAMEAAQRMPVSPTVNIVNQGMYFPLVFEVISRACLPLTPATPFIVSSMLLLVSF